MAVERLSQTKPKVNSKPVANARIRKVDGTEYISLGSNPIDPDNLSETQKINKDTGYFGKTIQQINEE